MNGRNTLATISVGGVVNMITDSARCSASIFGTCSPIEMCRNVISTMARTEAMHCEYTPDGVVRQHQRQRAFETSARTSPHPASPAAGWRQ